MLTNLMMKLKDYYRKKKRSHKKEENIIQQKVGVMKLLLKLLIWGKEK